jgi:hypothetical protein
MRRGRADYEDLIDALELAMTMPRRFVARTGA